MYVLNKINFSTLTRQTFYHDILSLNDDDLYDCIQIWVRIVSIFAEIKKSFISLHQNCDW